MLSHNAMAKAHYSMLVISLLQNLARKVKIFSRSAERLYLFIATISINKQAANEGLPN